MRSILGAVCGCLALVLAAKADAGEIKVLTWSSYLSPDVVQKFEKDTGIKVKVDTVTNYVDLLQPLLTGKSGYDIAFPADFQVRDLIQKGLLEKVYV
ncbi:MAG TPA: extracellular solute-binding protein, partial [Candidatus Omnitrophota bacterium]|nr:extracellular solute-binding protein [Candidatus Omnitrophota bacterium]